MENDILKRDYESYPGDSAESRVLVDQFNKRIGSSPNLGMTYMGEKYGPDKPGVMLREENILRDFILVMKEMGNLGREILPIFSQGILAPFLLKRIYFQK